MDETEKAVLQFRERMAEKGVELDIETATQVFAVALKIIQASRTMSQMDLVNLIEKDDDLSSVDKDLLVEIFQYAREL